ncbi:MAG: HAD family hydrolase, partial [Deltaproteobacteria bacterium]
MFKGFIFDLDGTVYLSDRLVPGADRVIRLLRENGKRVAFLSNKPVQTREDYAAKLTRLGIPTRPDEVVNSTLVMINFLKKNAPQARVFIVGEPPFIEEVKRAGFVITEEPKEIDYVVVAFDRTFDY